MALSSLPDDLIQQIREALKQATPGPWRAATQPHPEAVRLRTEAASVYGPDGLIYTQARDYGCLPETWARQQADAELICLLRNHADSLLASLASASGARTWQPMETAPKDRPILAYDEGAILVVTWVEADEDDGVPAGWWDSGIMEPPPSHWMPLPAPPEAVPASADEQKET